MIVKAEHLGVITGVDINLKASDGVEAHYALVNDEYNSLVYNTQSGLCECVNLVNPEEDVPQTIAKVFRHPERKKWLEAIQKEYMSLISKGTWRMALLPKGRRLLGCRLVLKRKVDKNGEVASYKARCVIQGNTQQGGVDYDRLFQPVAALSTLRNQCCFALQRKQDLKSFDFEQAFVQALPDRDVYIRWPPGIRPLKDHASGRDTCLKAEKALYGLKQSPRCWGMKLHKFLIKEGFERSDTDSCLYLMTRKRTKAKDSSLEVHDRFDRDYTQIALVVYVDDLTARVDLDCPETKGMYDKFVKNMFKEFVVEDRGILDSMLGYKIDYDKERGLLKLTQKSCLLELLERTGLSECRTKRTPAEAGIKPHIKWSPDPETEAGKKEIEWLKEQDYANRVGSTSWLSRGSRPETAWTTGMLARFLTKQSKKCYDMTTRLIRYLSTTRDRGLVYRRQQGELKLVCYVDGDWLTDYGNDGDNRKCTTGYALILCGAAVTWRSFKQQRVAGSSTESEYQSLWSATREVMHTRRQMKECGFEQFKPTVVNEDNQAAKRLSEDVVESTRTRHWDKEYHQIREEFERGTIIVEYCDTNLNAADVLTKSLSEPVHTRHTNILCGIHWDADKDAEYQSKLPVDRMSSFGKQELHRLESETNSKRQSPKSEMDVQTKGVSEYLKAQISTKGGVNNHPDRTPTKAESNNRNGRTGVRKTGGWEAGGRR